MLEGKSMPFNMAANTNHPNFVVKSKYHKISPLNAFPLKFRVYDNFYVVCQILVQEAYQRAIFLQPAGLATKQCCATSWRILSLVFRRHYSAELQTAKQFSQLQKNPLNLLTVTSCHWKVNRDNPVLINRLWKRKKLKKGERLTISANSLRKMGQTGGKQIITILTNDVQQRSTFRG